MKRTAETLATETTYADSRGLNPFARPQFSLNRTNFSVAPKGSEDLSLITSIGALSSPYFRPGGGPSDAYSAGNGQLLQQPDIGNPPGTASNLPSWGSPSFAPVATKGFLSNQTVVGNSTRIRSEDKRDELPGIHDLLIMEIPSRLTNQQVRLINGQTINETPKSAWLLPSFNYFLLQKQRKASAPQNPPPSSGWRVAPPEGWIDRESIATDPVNWSNPLSILTNFHVYGAVEASEQVSPPFTSTPRLASNAAFSGSETVDVGVVISARARVFNIWGPNVRTGERLFLILRPTKVPDYYVTNAYNATKKTIKHVTEEQKKNFPEQAFQMIPYATMGSRPPQSELLYHGPDGELYEAPYITFAVVYKLESGAGEHNPLLAATDADFIRRQGLLDVMVAL